MCSWSEACDDTVAEELVVEAGLLWAALATWGRLPAELLVEATVDEADDDDSGLH